VWRTPSLMPVASTTVSGRVELASAAETKAASSAVLAVTPVSLVNALEVPVEITIPLADPIVASADTTLTPRYTYKDPWVAGAARRIGAFWVEFETNVGGDVTLQLYKNGAQITGAELTVGSGTTEPAAGIDSFTEVTLADGDYLTVVQTTGRTDAIQGVVHVYGYELVVPAGDTL
ncbi:hypothetical protein LCGC14_1974780, partial [marine sediment metagenome]